jgi:hypothetical protein
MIKRTLYKIQTIGIRHLEDYNLKKELISFNSIFAFAILFLTINELINLNQKFYYLFVCNLCVTITMGFLFFLNHKNKFKIAKHLSIIITELYVYFFCLGCGKQIAFEYYYGLTIVLVAFVITNKKHLYFHLGLTLLFYVCTKISYNCISPLQYVNPNDFSSYNINNTITLLVLTGVLSIVFRTQNNKFLQEIADKKQVIEEQKILVDKAYEILHDKNKEVMDSIHYAKRIQNALITSEKYIDKTLNKLMRNN